MPLITEGQVKQPSNSPPDKKPESTTQNVIAEGIGSTPDEALKNAFRNAVRQVVGAVVETDTLIENDELIDDKVLTYSDGFIKSYAELDGSKKAKGGLHSIRITAQVERRGLVEKLTAANIALIPVDGKNLFAEVVTKLEAEQDAAALLKKQFEGFPQSCIKASILGKPEIVEKSSTEATFRLVVQIEPDWKAFKAFSDRLTPTLRKLATLKGEYNGTYTRTQKRRDTTGREVFEYYSTGGNGGEMNTLKGLIPNAFDGSGHFGVLKENHAWIAITTSRTLTADGSSYLTSWFAVDPSLQPIFVNVASRTGYAKVHLIDNDGKAISTVQFPLLHDPSSAWDNYTGTLLSSYGKRFTGNDDYLSELGLTIDEMDRPEYLERRKERAYLFILSPTFAKARSDKLAHRRELTFPCMMSLSLDELKSVKNAKVELRFNE